MQLTDDVMLERMRSRDATSDGVFVVGVLSTGIYCLPSCPARKPLAKNTRFFPDEDAARAAGLRACKRCRPDHFYRDFDPDLEAVEDLVREVRRAPEDFAGIGDLAARTGLGRTKLTELFRQHLHDTPAGFLARERTLAAAERLARDPGRTLDAGLSVGFESTSALHDNFLRHLALPPGEYRALARKGEPFRLRLPKDFRTEDTLRRLGRDTESLSERREGNRFAVAFRVGTRAAVLEMELERGSARCEIHMRGKTSQSAWKRGHELALRLLGLRSDAGGFERRVRRLTGGSRLIRGRAGLRIPLTIDAFDALVWSIVGQQVNLAFAMTLRRRVIATAESPEYGGLRAHPEPDDVAELDYGDLTPQQFSQRKAEYVIDSARAIANGEFDLEGLGRGTATRAEQALLARRGIGPWSANYVLMRGFGFADSLPVGDAGLVAALQRFFDLPERPGPEETRERMQPFRPHRSLACIHLWQSLGDET